MKGELFSISKWIKALKCLYTIISRSKIAKIGIMNWEIATSKTSEQDLKVTPLQRKLLLTGLGLEGSI